MPSGNFSRKLSSEAFILSLLIVFCLIASSVEENRIETKGGGAERQMLILQNLVSY